MVASLPCTPWLPLGFAIACGVAVLVVIPVGVSKKSKTATIALGVAAFAVGLAALILFIVQMQQQCYGSSCCCDGSGSGSSGGGGVGVGVGGQYGGAQYGGGQYGGGQYGGAGGHAGSGAKVLTWDPVVAVRDFHSGSAPAEVATTPSHTEPTKEPAETDTQAAAAQTQAAQAIAAAAVSETVAARLPFWAGLPNPVTMYDERQRMWARPETPEITTRRRQTMLREAAAELRLPRDGSMIPVGPPTVVTADPVLAAAVTRTLTEPQLQLQPQP
jgi:hypothetical protein